MSEVISVIIPTYQHAGSLNACLDSVFAQTYEHIEVIVVDDGSTDNTQEVLMPYADRITLMEQENQGSQKARMRGFDASRGAYVLFCDADVVLRSDMIELMHRTLLDHPEASYAYCGFTFGWKTFHPVAFAAERLKRHNYIHTTSLIRRDAFPGFDPAITRLQDWDLWLTMLGQGNVGIVVPEILFHARIDGTSRIGTAWMPSLMYALPWQWIGWRPKRLRMYEEAREIIAQKHHL